MTAPDDPALTLLTKISEVWAEASVNGALTSRVVAAGLTAFGAIMRAQGQKPITPKMRAAVVALIDALKEDIAA